MAWKKVIVSGSNAQLAQVTASTGINIGTDITGTTSHEVLVIDGSGNVGKLSQASVTGNNTTYTIDTSLSGGNGVITLTDNGGGTDTISLNAGTHITMSESGDAITISSTDTVYSPPGDGANVNKTFSGIEKMATLVVASDGRVTGATFESIQDGTTGQKGVVQLSDSTGSTSIALAATANSVKQVADALDTLDTAVGGVGNLTANEITQLEAINSVTISNTQWGYLGSMNQGVATSGTPTFAGVTSAGTISGSVVNAATANVTTLNVNGSATMTGSLVFNGVSFTETSTLTNTGSNTFGGNDTTQTFSGSSTFMQAPIFNTALGVASGGTGATTLTDGGVLLGSGTGAITAMAVLADGAMIVGDGTGDPVAESGATLRTSIGVGTTDTPQFTGLDLGGTDATLTKNSAGDLNIEGNIIYRAGGTDVPITDGGTGLSTLPTGLLVGAGTGTITAKTIGIADDNIVEIDDTDAANGDYAKFTANGIAGRNFQEVRQDLGLTAFFNATIATDGSSGVANGEAGLVTGNAVYDYINAQGFGQGSGDIGAVNAGEGLTGGGTTGEVTMSVGAGTGITVNANDVAITATQTGISSIKHDSLVIGRATGNDHIDFSSGGSIKLKTDNTDRLTVTDAGATIVGTLNVTDLNVTGTTTTVNTTNVTIQDAFIALGTGASGTDTDSGIIFGAGSGVEGDSLFWDGSYNSNDGRLGVAHAVALTDNSATAGYWVGGVIEGDAAAAQAALADHKGNIRIDGGEIYIYAT